MSIGWNDFNIMHVIWSNDTFQKNTSPEECLKPNPIEADFKSPKAKDTGEHKSKNQQVEKSEP